MKNNKGITLIALIITIIVMLILVAVTVSVVVNSNLIGTAKGAGENTELAYEEDKTYGMNVNINGNIYTSVGDYPDNPREENGGAGDDEIVIEGSIKIATNPTHVIYILGTPYLIDNSTQWSELATCEEPVTLTWEEDDNYEGVSTCYVNGKRMGSMSVSDIEHIEIDEGEFINAVGAGGPFMQKSTNPDIPTLYNDLILSSGDFLINFSNENTCFGFDRSITFSSSTLTLKECLEEAHDNLVYAVSLDQLEA